MNGTDWKKVKNDLNLERETDIYQFVHLVRFIDENLQRRLKKPTNVLLTRKFTEEVEETNQCFENSQWRLFCLFHRLFASTGYCCIQCHSVTIPQRCSTTGNLPALQLVLSLSTTQVTCPGRQVNPSLLSLLS